MQEELLAIAKKAVDAGAAAGVRCEAFVQKSRLASVTVEGGKVTFGAMDGDYGIGLRVVKDRRPGYAYCSEAMVEYGLRQAIAATRYGKPGDYAFPGDEGYAGGRSPYDNRIASLVPEDGIALAREMLEGAAYDPRALAAGGGVVYGTVAMAVANTSGVAIYDEGTRIGGSLTSIIKEDGQVANGDETEMSRTFDVDFGRIGRTATEVAAGQLGQRGIATAPMTVILRPSAAFDILANTALPALYGMAVRKGESVYGGRIGEAVASRGLSLVDDATLGKGLNTYAMDEEGCASRKNVLIGDGALEMFLYDAFSAAECGARPTGSALHADRMESGTTYRVPPTTCARNVVLEGPAASEEEMIRDTRRGVLVLDVLGAHTANRTSGDFSVAIYAGYAIEDGEIAYPLKGGMIGGNLPRMLLGAGLANNHRLVTTGMSPATGYVPSVKFENVRVAGD